MSDASYTQGIDERLDSPTRDEKNDSKVRALLGEASAAIDRLAALASKVQPKGKAPSLKADDYRAAWEAAKIAWARRTDAPKPWSALSFAEQLELVVDGANRAAAQCAAEGDATDWQAIARVQSAKLAVALDEPGARERLEAAMRSADWKADPQPKVADDSARLDWIAEHWFYTDIFERISFSFNECWDAGEHPNLRAAIDAAMAAVKPPVQGSAT